MSKHMTIINLAYTITKLRKWGEAWKHSAESAQAATARMHQANKELEREKFMTAGLIDKLIADRDAAWKERDTQAADHETKMVEHRTAFGVRTEADAKIIAGLREELDRVRNSLGIQAAKEANKVLGMVDGEGLRGAAERVVKERDALRAEVAALRERLRASIARGDLAQIEVAALKSQTPKQHPVMVGEWVRKTTDGLMYKAGERFRLTSYEIIDGKIWCNLENGASWLMSVCEPCDPPHTEPVPKRAHPVAVGGYLRRLTGFNTTPAGEVARVTLVDDDDPSQLEYEVVRPNGQKGRWSAKGCEPCDPPEASHDTPAGKEAAEAADKDEIKVGDVVEVVSASGGQTWMADVGSTGKVRRFELIDSIECVRLQNLPGKRNAQGGYVSLCDVRKVPQ